MKVGDTTISTTAPDFAKQLVDAIVKHGYPASANPADINYVMTVILLTILVIYVTLVYAPIAAWLVELFPTRIRYSGMSLPSTSVTAGSAASCRPPSSPSLPRPEISIPACGTRSSWRR